MTPSARPARIGFMLTQLGTHVAGRFAARTRQLGLTPAQAGIIRILGRQPGISQRDLADKLGAAPSRIVALIDLLESMGYVVRSRSTTDRRNHELRLTAEGRAVLDDLRTVAEAHESEITAGLTASQREELAKLLGSLMTTAGLDADVHLGYSASEGDPSHPG